MGHEPGFSVFEVWRLQIIMAPIVENQIMEKIIEHETEAGHV